MKPWFSGNVHFRSLSIILWLISSGSHFKGVDSIKNFMGSSKSESSPTSENQDSVNLQESLFLRALNYWSMSWSMIFWSKRSLILSYES